MDNISFGFDGLDRHGGPFYQFLALRKQFFVDRLGWDIPHDETVEMDQYDNPTARYSLVLRNGQVVGGARVMPTSAVWGRHTYMLADAAAGRLEDIPASVLAHTEASDEVWECTRLVISDALQTQADRSRCLSLIVSGLVSAASARGAERLISLSPLSLVRALRQLGFGAERVGQPYLNEGDGRRYAVLSMPAVKQHTLVPPELAARQLSRPAGAQLHAPSID